MTRVLHLITTMPVGGAENLILTTMRLLDPKQFSSVLCCIQGQGPLGLEAEQSGFKVVTLNRMKQKQFDSQAVADIEEVIRREQVDIVHCHLYHAALYGRLAAKRAKIPSIVTVHNIYSKPKWHRCLLNWWLGRHTAKIIAVSHPVGNDVLHHDHIDKQKLVVIPNGIDLSLMHHMLDSGTAKERLGLSANDLIIGCIGRLEPQKGHLLLLEALSLLRKERGDSPHLVIVGEGSQHHRICDKIASEHLQDRVHLLGSRRDIPEILAAFDIFVLPSLWEGLPLALLEAMAAGVPVIASAVGGVGEVLNHGEYGIALPPGDVQALYSAIAGLLSPPEKRVNLGQRGAKRVVQDYSAASMVHQLEEVYSTVDRIRKTS